MIFRARMREYTDPKDIIGKNDYQMVWRDQAELYRDDDLQIIESGSSSFHRRTDNKGNTITASYQQVTFAQF